MLTLACLSVALLMGTRPAAVDPSQPIIQVGWHDELDSARHWSPLVMENQAHVRSDGDGKVHLWLDLVPEGWPYTYQWSGLNHDAEVDIAHFPVLMAKIDQVKGYAHLDIDVLNAQGKATKTLRTATVNGPGLSTIDFTNQLDPAVYSLRVRLIVGGENAGCSATYDWVRFVSPKDAAFLSAHPDYNRIREIKPPKPEKRQDPAGGYDITEVCESPVSAAINANGLVAGTRYNPKGELEAFVWSKNKKLWTGSGYTLASGPNAKGQVALTYRGQLRIWERNRVRDCQDLKVQGGLGTTVQVCEILGIDDSGTIMAKSGGTDDVYPLVIWPKTLTKNIESWMCPTDGPGYARFFPLVYGSDGSLAGVSGHYRSYLNPTEKPATWIHRNGKSVKLPDNPEWIVPIAVAPNSEMVGQMGTERNKPFWWRGGEIVQLRLPNDKSTGEVRALNNHSVIVGTVTYMTYSADTQEPTGDRKCAAIWTAGQLRDLNDLVQPPRKWELLEAWSINDRGDILAIGTRAGTTEPTRLVLLRHR